VVFLWSDQKYALGWYGGNGWCEYAGIRHDGSSAPLAVVAIFTEFFGAIALTAGLLGRIAALHDVVEDAASDPSMFAAITPRVAVINNAPAKGGSAGTLRTLRAATGTDTWQLHRSAAAGAENFADERIANLDETTAHWIKISASADGSFTVTNARTDATVRYPAR
jgi:hypothetical protein